MFFYGGLKHMRNTWKLMFSCVSEIHVKPTLQFSMCMAVTFCAIIKYRNNLKKKTKQKQNKTKQNKNKKKQNHN